MEKLRTHCISLTSYLIVSIRTTTCTSFAGERIFSMPLFPKWQMSLSSSSLWSHCSRMWVCLDDNDNVLFISWSRSKSMSNRTKNQQKFAKDKTGSGLLSWSQMAEVNCKKKHCKIHKGRVIEVFYVNLCNNMVVNIKNITKYVRKESIILIINKLMMIMIRMMMTKTSWVDSTHKYFRNDLNKQRMKAESTVVCY